MLINLISSSNYQSYNVIIAKALGLETAVYLNALIEINEKAIRKNKLVDEHFLIDRNYILERTNIDTKTWNKYKNKEWYLYAEDQTKYHICDKIVEDINEIM